MQRSRDKSSLFCAFETLGLGAQTLCTLSPSSMPGRDGLAVIERERNGRAGLAAMHCSLGDQKDNEWPLGLMEARRSRVQVIILYSV